MIKFTTVGPHDINTKENLFKDKGALTVSMISHKDLDLYKVVFNVWPGNCMYEILDNYWNRIRPLWLAPIDLGDNIKLSPARFMEMVQINFKGQSFEYASVLEYLRQLVDEDSGVYKFMATMEKMDKEKKGY